MAFFVRRPKGRWEIREAFRSPKGPRSRTLASFLTLTDEVVDHAIRASDLGIDREGLLRAARRAGVPFRPEPADELAASLLRHASHGSTPRLGLSRLVRHVFADFSPLPSSIDESFIEWIGSTAQARGEALVDLLDLADSLPSRRSDELKFPGLSPERLRQ